MVWARNVGVLTMRSTSNGANYNTGPGEFLPVTGYENLNMLGAIQLSNTTVAATVLGYVDHAISCGSTLILYGHEVVTTATTTTQVSIAVLQAIVDGLVTRVSGGNLDVITVSQLYSGLTDNTRGNAIVVPAGGISM
jgi:hypothetical protein